MPSKREILNQLINSFWTVLCFTPVIWFWIKHGINLYFQMTLALSLIIGILPGKIFSLLILSSRRSVYEKLGVKHIRKLVQNGTVVNAIPHNQKRFVLTRVSQAKQYLKTIAMYERFHWICFTFFLMTTIRCFMVGDFKLGIATAAVNILYNVCSILLQQYNKLRIHKMTGHSAVRITKI
jgi:hypothetical protein